MAEVVLFHSALGLRPGVLSAAERLREAGHVVHTPDLYDGEVFEDYAEGGRKRDALGYAEIARRAREAVVSLPAETFYAGFSLGTAPAELLAASRKGARGAVLMHGAIPIQGFRSFGVEGWPAGVPMQVHYAEGDPWVEAEEVVALGEAVRGTGTSFEEYVYPGSGHLFADPDLPDEYDAGSADLMWRRVLGFLERVDA
jgi:dienelactone hydrolase